MMADSTARYDRDVPVLWYPGVSLFETSSWLSPAGYLTRMHCTARRIWLEIDISTVLHSRLCMVSFMSDNTKKPRPYSIRLLHRFSVEQIGRILHWLNRQRGGPLGLVHTRNSSRKPHGGHATTRLLSSQGINQKRRRTNC